MHRLLSLAALALAMVFGLALPAQAQGPIETYCALISNHDKVASDGFKLTDAGSILRQDRANYHRFGTPDRDDTGDGVFDTPRARENIPTMLDNGDIEPGLAREIVRGNPYICVDVYRNALSVYRGEGNDGAAKEADYPFVGTWDCEVAVLSFDARVYNNGLEDLPIRDIQEGSDGSYTLFFDDDYSVTLADFRRNSMSWLSGASGDVFTCQRLDS